MISQAFILPCHTLWPHLPACPPTYAVSWTRPPFEAEVVRNPRQLFVPTNMGNPYDIVMLPNMHRIYCIRSIAAASEECQ